VKLAFLLINCDFQFGEEVINELWKLPKIIDVYRLHGMHDIIARVKSDGGEELNQVQAVFEKLIKSIVH
jgi:hypothetical protein